MTKSGSPLSCNSLTNSSTCSNIMSYQQNHYKWNIHGLVDGPLLSWTLCISTHSRYVILNVVLLQQMLHELASMLRNMYIACRVINISFHHAFACPTWHILLNFFKPIKSGEFCTVQTLYCTVFNIFINCNWVCHLVAVHIHTQTIPRTTQITTNVEECGSCHKYNLWIRFVAIKWFSRWCIE
jgi:hypothetical protein